MRTRPTILCLVLLFRPNLALASESRHGFDVMLGATLGYLFYRARRTEQYTSAERYALLDVETQEHSAMFGGDARVGYKLVFSPRVALTPVVTINYSRGRTQTRHYDTESFSYPLQAAPGVFSMLLGAEVLLRDELIGLQLGIGAGSMKLHSREAAKGGPALLLAGRIRLPSPGAFSASLGLGAELTRLSPLGLSPGTVEYAVQQFLRIGIEFDGSDARGAS